MQLYSIIRGPLRNAQRMLEEMQAQVFTYKFRNKDYYINWNVRTIQLVEHLFPEEHLQVILRSIPGQSEHGVPQIAKRLIQKQLKLKPVPEIEKGEKRLIFGDGMQNVLLGIREDKTTVNFGEHI